MGIFEKLNTVSESSFSSQSSTEKDKNSVNQWQELLDQTSPAQQNVNTVDEKIESSSFIRPKAGAPWYMFICYKPPKMSDMIYNAVIVTIGVIIILGFLTMITVLSVGITYKWNFKDAWSGLVSQVFRASLLK